MGCYDTKDREIEVRKPDIVVVNTMREVVP